MRIREGGPVRRHRYSWKTAEYIVWASMRARTAYRDGHKAKNYIDRGITVCDRWWSGDENGTGFDYFYEDMGPRPSNQHSLDRIDNDNGYSPDNCRWATRKEQQRNRTVNIWVTAFGETRLLADWVSVSPASYFTIRNRLRTGWPAEDAIMQPVDSGKKLATRRKAA